MSLNGRGDGDQFEDEKRLKRGKREKNTGKAATEQYFEALNDAVNPFSGASYALRLASAAYRKSTKSNKPEAVVKVVSQPRGHRVNKLADYIARIGKEGEELPLEDEMGAQVHGEKEIAERCAEWSQDYERAKPNTQRPPRHATHLILSAGNVEDPAKMREVMNAARDVLQKKFAAKGYDYMAVLHTDTGRPHVHVVIRNKSREKDTPKLRLNPPELLELRTRFAAELEKRGIEQTATLRRDRPEAVAEIAKGLERIKKQHGHFEAQMKKASPSVDAFAQRRRLAAQVKKMRETIKNETKPGTRERVNLLDAVKTLNRELKKPQADMPKALDATARKLGKDVAKVSGHYSTMRKDLETGALRLSEKKERVKSIEKLAKQVERDIKSARMAIYKTMTDPDAKAKALKALSKHQTDLMKAIRTVGRLGPEAKEQTVQKTVKKAAKSAKATLQKQRNQQQKGKDKDRGR